MINSPVFFCGIGGSGMLPLASIVRAGGAGRGLGPLARPGRTPHKFDYLRSLGIQLFPQDGSGLQDGQTSSPRPRSRRRCRTSCARNELGLAHLTRPAIPRASCSTRAAQRRGRRHQRQVDGHRHDRLDPPRLPPPADSDERRGDEEFRHAHRRRSPARWSATPSCSSARSTRATARSRSTGPRSPC